MTSRASKAGKKAVAKRMVQAKKTAPAKKPEPKKGSVSKIATKVVPAKKAASAKPVPTAGKPLVLKQTIPAKPAIAAVKPHAAPNTGAPSAPRPTSASANSPQQADERRKAATRKFFARLRSLEAIVGADLRKRGSLVLMQAVDQWYSEAVSATATEVTITNAAKAVIGHL
jgi:hypothetical protein